MSQDENVGEERLELERQMRLIREVLLGYEANQRVGTAKTKTRAEVCGASRKLYKQKGTGRARAGNRRTPVRVGGGHAFAKSPRDWRKRITKKARIAALNTALASLSRIDRVVTCKLPDSCAVSIATVKKWLGDGINQPRLLLVTGSNRPDLVQALKNFRNVTITERAHLNIKQVAVAKCLIIDTDCLGA